MLRKDLIAALSEEMNIPKEWVIEFVRQYEKIIRETLASGEDIRFTDFLTYKIVLDKGGSRWNIRVNDKVYVPPKYRLKIRATGEMKRLIENQPVSKYERDLYMPPSPGVNNG